MGSVSGYLIVYFGGGKMLRCGLDWLKVVLLYKSVVAFARSFVCTTIRSLGQLAI